MTLDEARLIASHRPTGCVEATLAVDECLGDPDRIAFRPCHRPTRPGSRLCAVHAKHWHRFVSDRTPVGVVPY